MSGQSSISETSYGNGLSLFESGVFEKMELIAMKIADSPVLPETLRGTRKNNTFTPFKPAEVLSNCFRLVEQSSRWGMSPFAIMDGASVIYGKLMWEGKVIAAAISSLTKTRLNYEYEGVGVNRKVIVSGQLPDEDFVRSVEGTVKDWKTDQWEGSAFDQRLAYRGAREWSRRHTPEVIFGVYATDEFNESEMRDVTKTGPATTISDDEVESISDLKLSSPDGRTYREAHEDKGEESVGVSSSPISEPSKPADSSPAHPAGMQPEQASVDIVELMDLSDSKQAEGRTWWEVQVKTQKGNAVKLHTFAANLVEFLGGRIGDDIKITFLKTERGTFELKDADDVQVDTGKELV